MKQHLNSLLLGIALLTGASDAMAANLYQDRQLVQEANIAARGWDFSTAEYKLRTVYLDVANLVPSMDKNRLVQALQQSRSALSNPNFSAYQKVQVVEDCSRTAIESIDRLIAQGGGQSQGRLALTARHLRSVPEIYQQGLYGGDPYGYRAANALREADNTLRAYAYDSDLDYAQLQIRRGLDILNDGYASSQQKLAVLRDVSQAAVNAVLRSRSYRIEQGNPPPPYPPANQLSLVCSSNGNGYNACYTGVFIKGLNVQAQHSGAPCTHGYSYGIAQDRTSIWVDRGCRATFLVRY